MKRSIIIVWCILYILLLSACKNNVPIDPSTATGNTATSSPNTDPAPTIAQEEVYKNITCEKITNLQEVTFCVSNSRTQIHVMFPENWKLKKTDQGYNILRSSKVIGTVSTSTDIDISKSVHKDSVEMSGVKMTSHINCIAFEGQTTYIRTISYQYKEAEGNTRTIVITVPYENIDDDAAWKMLVKTKKTSAPDPQMGILRLDEDRKSVLILGNSFVSTSKISTILQKMCGSELSVEAQSRGYARITTYVQDQNVMNRIRSGDYGAVILCGLYDLESVTSLEQMIDACESSKTKLAIFPAHNENSSLIGTAGMLHPDALFLNWKEEINSLISSGIDETHFCIADSHKHSTPLAGYVGAHMIYRAIFGKVPTANAFTQVSKAELSLLGNYTSTGLVSFSKPENTYPLQAD